MIDLTCTVKDLLIRQRKCQAATCKDLSPFSFVNINPPVPSHRPTNSIQNFLWSTADTEQVESLKATIRFAEDENRNLSVHAYFGLEIHQLMPGLHYDSGYLLSLQRTAAPSHFHFPEGTCLTDGTGLYRQKYPAKAHCLSCSEVWVLIKPEGWLSHRL